MNAKAVVGVIIVAILIGVLYVVFEKNFMGETTLSNSATSSSKEVPRGTMTQATTEESSLLKYPQPTTSGSEVDGSTDLLQDAQGLEMRDYSGLFEELKGTL